MQKITVEPALQEVILEDQVEIPVTIELENTADIAQSFLLKAVDFGTLDESGGVAFLGTGDPREYDVASWLSIPVNEILVPPASKTKLTVVITNSGKLAPGGHYGALLFENNTPNSEGQGDPRIAVRQVFSSLIYMRKVGGEVFSLSLNNFSYPKNTFFLPKTTDIRFTNDGNTHVVPRGSIRVTDPLGRTVERAILNQESALVLPKATRVFQEDFSSLGLAWLPGRYTVLLEYRYDGKESYEKKIEKYWHIPLWSIGVITGLVGTVFVVRSRRFAWKNLKKTFGKKQK
ncbi:MAG: hypothetical protein KIH67_000295 [Candidatus Moranbacteria bacterium]|nr:hypothetical protein [Candidatus Moranbacteria bacterium]